MSRQICRSKFFEPALVKNIIFILTDQQHFRTIRANGCAEADTPHLDRLAGIGEELTGCGRRLLDFELALNPDGERDSVLSEWRAYPFEKGSTGDILSIRTPSARLARYANTGEEEFYDLTNDPGERRNIAGDHRAEPAMDEMLQKLAASAPPVPKLPPPAAPW
jgi:hypothetical protein